MISVFFGVLAMGIGAWGAFYWHQQLLIFMKGFLPVSLCLAGIIAVVVGLSSRSPNRRLPPSDSD